MQNDALMHREGLKEFNREGFHSHLYPLQAANSCHNSRLVVDEDDLKWVANEKNILLFLKQIPRKLWL